MHHSVVVEISCRYGGCSTDRGGVRQQGSQTGGRVSDPKLGLGGGLFHVAYLFVYFWPHRVAIAVPVFSTWSSLVVVLTVGVSLIAENRV